jgi:Holliday junction resolvasome RuvABC endonuclease subunit
MGLDLSMTGTGVCIMDGTTIIHQKLITTKPIKEKTGKIIKKKGKEVEEEVSIEGEDLIRIKHIKDEIHKSMKEVDFLSEYINIRETCIAIEGPSYGMEGKTSSIHTLGKLMGIIEYWFTYELLIQYTIIPPTTLKKIITGKGVGKKEMMLKEVYKKFGLDFNDNNLCDAFCLCSTLVPPGIREFKLATPTLLKKRIK